MEANSYVRVAFRNQLLVSPTLAVGAELVLAMKIESCLHPSMGVRRVVSLVRIRPRSPSDTIRGDGETEPSVFFSR